MNPLNHRINVYMGFFYYWLFMLHDNNEIKLLKMNEVLLFLRQKDPTAGSSGSAYFLSIRIFEKPISFVRHLLGFT